MWETGEKSGMWEIMLKKLGMWEIRRNVGYGRWGPPYVYQDSTIDASYFPNRTIVLFGNQEASIVES